MLGELLEPLMRSRSWQPEVTSLSLPPPHGSEPPPRWYQNDSASEVSRVSPCCGSSGALHGVPSPRLHKAQADTTLARLVAYGTYAVICGDDLSLFLALFFILLWLHSVRKLRHEFLAEVDTNESNFSLATCTPILSTSEGD